MVLGDCASAEKRAEATSAILGNLREAARRRGAASRSASSSQSHLPNRDVWRLSLGLPGLKAVADALADEANPTHLRELDLPDVGVDQAGAARLLQAVRRNGELARLDLRRNELPPKVVKMLAKQARGFRKESDDDVPLELLLEPQEKSE